MASSSVVVPFTPPADAQTQAPAADAQSPNVPGTSEPNQAVSSPAVTTDRPEEGPTPPWKIWVPMISIMGVSACVMAYSVTIAFAICDVLLYAFLMAMAYATKKCYCELIVQYGAKCMYDIRTKCNWYTLLTSLVLHANFWHLFGNLFAHLSCYSLEIAVKDKGLILELYVLSGLMGNFLSGAIRPYCQSVGASGCLCGVLAYIEIGAQLSPNPPVGSLTIYYWAIFAALHFIIIVLMCFGYVCSIDIWGHFGGLIFGGLLSYGRDHTLAFADSIPYILWGAFIVFALAMCLRLACIPNCSR
jgi:rhomboid protease GluP